LAGIPAEKQLLAVQAEESVRKLGKLFELI
jgi:hypothetical protein